MRLRVPQKPTYFWSLVPDENSGDSQPIPPHSDEKKVKLFQRKLLGSTYFI